MQAQSYLKKIQDGVDTRRPRAADARQLRQTSRGAVYTHVNKSGPGRKIRAASILATAHSEISKAKEAVVRFLGRGE